MSFRIGRGVCRALLVAGSLAFSLVALEGVFRLLDIRPRFSHTRYVDTAACLQLETHPFGSDDGATRLSRSFYTYKPLCTWSTEYPSNPRGYFDDHNRISYRMNSAGFRDREFTPRRANICRIVAIGDSLTMGEGVWPEDAYPRALEVRLRHSGYCVEVYNLGVGGYGIRDVAAALDVVLAEHRPDAVIFGYYLNDISRPAFDRWVSETLDARKTTVRESPFRVVNFVQEALWGWRFTKSYLAFVTTVYQDVDRWQDLTHYLSLIRHRVESAGAVFHVVVFPDLNLADKRNYAFAPIHSRLAEFFHQQNIDFIDLTEAFRNYGAKRLKVHPVDAHPNEIAHRMVGEYLADWFGVRSGLANGCSEGPECDDN